MPAVLVTLPHLTPPDGLPSYGTPLSPGHSEYHLVLLPTHVERLPGNLLRTSFEGGLTHVGGSVREMRITQRRAGPRVTGVAFEAVLGDQGYPTPEAYLAAGRDVTADLTALIGGAPTQAAAAPGHVVQSGCSKIDIRDNLYAYGCYSRKLAQKVTNGEILGETAQVSCQSRFYDMVQCGNELRHAWIDDRAYVFEWAPPGDQVSTSCTTKTWSLGHAGVSYSQSSQQCPTEYRIRIEGDPHGATFSNSWYGSVRNGVTRQAAAVDTYRWQVPAQYRGSLRYVVVIDTSPGATKTCSGTCTTR